MKSVTGSKRKSGRHFSLYFRFLFVAASALLIPNVSPTFAAETGALKKWNVRVFPVGLFLGEQMVDFNYSPISFFSVGAIGYHTDVEISDRQVEGFGYGIRGMIHLSGNHFEDTWFLGAYYLRIPDATLTSTSSFTGRTASATGLNASEFGATVGKIWVWSEGFNITFALGVRDSVHQGDYTLVSSDGTYTTGITAKGGIRLELALGWAF